MRCYFLMVSVTNVTTCRATCKTTQPFNDVLKYEHKDKRLEFEETYESPRKPLLVLRVYAGMLQSFQVDGFICWSRGHIVQPPEILK